MFPILFDFTVKNIANDSVDFVCYNFMYYKILTSTHTELRICKNNLVINSVEEYKTFVLAM